MPSATRSSRTANNFTEEYYEDFSGGVNYYFGPRQIDENESPDATNCDFKGRTGVGNRDGYTNPITLPAGITGGYGLAEFHNSTQDLLLAFLSNGANIQMYHSTGSGAMTAITGTFTDGRNMDIVQAGGYAFTGNGVDAMKQFNGTVWAATTNGTLGYYPEYYDKRIWVVDEQDPTTLNFSGQWAAASSKLGDFVDASAGTITIEPGSGKEIRAIKKFKDALYVFLFPYGIYRITPASAANTFTVELITNAVGCVSYRSVAQVEEDLMFAWDDGVYSLGDVAYYTAVRTTNKSAKVQRIFDSLSATNKSKLVGNYFKFKFHLFYSLNGTRNDSCAPYDIRYKGWQDWRNMAANDSINFFDTNGDTNAFYLEAATGKIMKMYAGSTDNGTAITSTWYSNEKSQKAPDRQKLYYDTTFGFGQLTGSVDVSVIFDDQSIGGSKTLSQNRPQGGFGRDAWGRKAFGDATNTVTITPLVNNPLRLKAKGTKFTIQYKITSTGSWRLDYISQWFMYFDHFKFPSRFRL
jgi:hypothetical protein